MAKLPSFKRLITSDFPKEFQQIIETLAGSLNYGIQVLYDVINGNLTLQDNLYSTIKTINTTVDINGNPPSNGGNSLLTFQLANSNGKVTGVNLLNISIIKNQSTDPTVYPSGGITLSWQQAGNQLIINHITGLNGTYNGINLVGKTWALTVIAYQQPISN